MILNKNLLNALFVLAGLFCASYALAAEVGSSSDQPGKSANAASFTLDEIAAPEQQPHRWRVSIEAIALKRNSNVSQPLTNTVPANQTWAPGSASPGNSTELFNSNQFNQGYQVGPKMMLEYRDHSGYDFELSYFNVLNLNASNTTGPNGNWLTMYAPGAWPSFWQTQDYPNQGFIWSTTTNLYSAEANAKTSVAQNFKLLAGFRWIQLNDTLTGGVTPADQFQPAWKTSTIPCTGSTLPTFPTFTQLQGCTNTQLQNLTPSNFSNFWITSTTNNLFGLQFGAEGDVLSIGKLSLGGLLKAGVYNNRATQSDWVSMAKQFYYASATRNRAAYVGEGAIQIKYHLTRDFAIKLGYELLWLNQIALAPGQISQTYSASSPTSLSVTGVNTSSSILFQGGTLGIEYAF